MSNNESTKYFDFHTTGIGYLNRVREVTAEEGRPFLSVTIAALRGSVDNVHYTHFARKKVTEGLNFDQSWQLVK